MNDSQPRPTPTPSQPNAPQPARATPTIRPIGAAAHPPRPAGAAPPGPVRRIEPPPPHVMPQVGAIRPPPPPARPADDEPISLEDEEPIELEEGASAPVAPAPPRLAALGSAGATAATGEGQAAGVGTPSKIKFYAGGDKHTYTKFKRPAHVGGTGACRVRTFHGRLSDDGLAYTDDKINEWLDNHPDVEIKHVNCLVGPLEGKVTGEQGLIVVIWY